VIPQTSGISIVFSWVEQIIIAHSEFASSAFAVKSIAVGPG
jgi:hypothetical protein